MCSPENSEARSFRSATRPENWPKLRFPPSQFFSGQFAFFPSPYRKTLNRFLPFLPRCKLNLFKGYTLCIGSQAVHCALLSVSEPFFVFLLRKELSCLLIILQSALVILPDQKEEGKEMACKTRQSPVDPTMPNM